PPGAAPAPAPAPDASAGDAAAAPVAPVAPLLLPAFICGILVPTAVWAGLHYGQYHGLVLVQVFVMGLFLAACRRRTNSLWLCILLHAANNAFSCWEYL
ncbi:MAG: CPBP family intramembrane metalloprotease, partial [Planctomycetes bacterium]|nr:CPBP family intramembrane metalloprotease [Planctomycetota bacterium]